jgi:nitrogen-specific signal transduction histidine kinase
MRNKYVKLSTNYFRRFLLELQENHRIIFKIKGDGIGVNEEIHNKLFVPNFTTKLTGMGFSILKYHRTILWKNHFHFGRDLRNNLHK